MGRVGLFADRAGDFFERLMRLPNCRWEGVYSHFATSDERDKTYADMQLTKFQGILEKIPPTERRSVMIHMANSGAVLDQPRSYFDAVRPGILMYGHYPSSETSESIDIRPVMTLKTTVSQVREMPAGHPISYGRRWTMPSAGRLAVLPIGYADGLRRDLTNKGDVLIRGRRYPMVGAVTMDQTMVYIGGDEVAVGDEALIWGESDQGAIRTAEVAESIGTIPYELTCGVSKRVPRLYRSGEKK